MTMSIFLIVIFLLLLSIVIIIIFDNLQQLNLFLFADFEDCVRCFQCGIGKFQKEKKTEKKTEKQVFTVKLQISVSMGTCC